MEKLIVVVFDDQAKAHAGLEALHELDTQGEISLFEVRTIAKEPDGSVQVVENPEDTDFPVIGVSTMVGALVGALGGPIGILGGAAAGAIIGSTLTLLRGDVTEEFVEDVSTALAPGKFALVADISEDCVTPLDTRMEPLGGVIFRRSRSQVRSLHHDRDVAAHRAEIQQLKAERAQARAERLDQIDARLDELGKKVERALLRDRSDLLLREEQRDARVRALREKADQSQGDIRRRLEARIEQLQRDYEQHETDDYVGLSQTRLQATDQRPRQV